MQIMYTNKELQDIIYNEGIGYAIEDYVSVDEIEDEVVRVAWQEAITAIAKIRKLLYDPEFG